MITWESGMAPRSDNVGVRDGSSTEKMKGVDGSTLLRLEVWMQATGCFPSRDGETNSERETSECGILSVVHRETVWVRYAVHETKTVWVHREIAWVRHAVHEKKRAAF